MQLISALLPLLASSTLVSGAALQPRALTASQMVANINQITLLSQNLQPIVNAIPTGETAIAKRQLDPFEVFQSTIDGFNQIISVANDDIVAMNGTQPYPDADATKVCAAFVEFVAVHQELLSILIGKSGLLESIFLGPVAAVLRSLEDVVDTLALGVIAAVPVCKADAITKKDALDEKLGEAVCAFTPGGTLGLTLFC